MTGEELRELRKSTGLSQVDALLAQIEAGKTLYIRTYTKTITIDAATVARWAKVGRPILKDGREGEGGFYVGRGRHYDYVSPISPSVHVYTE